MAQCLQQLGEVLPIGFRALVLGLHKHGWDLTDAYPARSGDITALAVAYSDRFGAEILIDPKPVHKGQQRTFLGSGTSITAKDETDSETCLK